MTDFFSKCKTGLKRFKQQLILLLNIHSIKSICIGSFSGPYFPVFSPNAGIIRTRNTPNLKFFYAVIVTAYNRRYLFGINKVLNKIKTLTKRLHIKTDMCKIKLTWRQREQWRETQNLLHIAGPDTSRSWKKHCHSLFSKKLLKIIINKFIHAN